MLWSVRLVLVCWGCFGLLGLFEFGMLTFRLLDFFWVSASVGWIAVALLGLFSFVGGCPCLLCLLLFCWAIQVMLSFVALPGFVALSSFLS